MDSSTQALLLIGGASAAVYFLYQESKKQQQDTPPDPIKGFYPVKLLPVQDNPANYPKPMCGFQVIHAHDRGVAWDKAMAPFNSKETCLSQAAINAAQPFLDSWKADDHGAWENGIAFESPVVWMDPTPGVDDQTGCWFIQQSKDANGQVKWDFVQNLCPNLVPIKELSGQ